MNHFEELKNTPCNPGELLVLWVAQAGFVVMNSKKQTVAIDCYLSNLSEVQDGNKRLTLPAVSAEEMNADLYLASHNHSDHLDVFSLPKLMADGTKLICSELCIPPCEKYGVPMDQVLVAKAGDSFDEAGFHIEAVFADHGDTAPDAVGWLIESEGVRVYFTGDTNYQYARMKPVTDLDIDLMLPCINGEYGNMNEQDAAMLAAQANPVLTVPCHFWTFARHQGSPYQFQLAMQDLAPGRDNYIMSMGEIIKCTCARTWQSVSHSM